MNFKSFIPAFLLLNFLFTLNSLGQTAAFSVSMESQCAPAVVKITNESSEGAGYEYYWDFDKGGLILSGEKVLYQSYAEPGSYTITLKLFDGSDTTQTSQEITIAEGPTANFTLSAATGCLPHEVQMMDNSNPGDAPINEYFWDLRNGITGNSNPFSYTYAEAGSYGIYYQVTDENGCIAYTELESAIEVYALPEVDFTASETFACDPPLNVTYTNQSSGYGTLDYEWNLGNGTTSSLYEPFTEYLLGSFDVSLQVTDGHGCSQTVTKPEYIAVGSPSSFIFAEQFGTEYFSDSTTLCPGEILFNTLLPRLDDMDWQIRYNGNLYEFENRQQVVMMFPDSGKIDVQLIYNTETNCGDTLYRTFYIEHLKANFTIAPDYSCQLPLEIMLENTSENASNITWHLPNGTLAFENELDFEIPSDTSYKQLFTHHLLETSNSFLLIAQSENGCADSISLDFDYELPVAHFAPDISQGCAPLAVTFSDSSRAANSITSISWLIDGNTEQTSDVDSFEYTFADPGTYSVQSIIETETGCLDTSYAVTIKVGEPGNPDFTVTPTNICPGDTIFLSGSTNASSAIDTWHYYSPELFNTGIIAQSDTFIVIGGHEAATYDISLVTESNGCLSDTVKKDVIELSAPAGNFNFSFDCNTPDEYNFTSDVPAATTYTWLIDGTEVSTDPDFNHTFAQYKNYTVELTAENTSGGCTLYQKKIIPVRDVEANFIVKEKGCINEPILLDASSSRDYLSACTREGFKWNFGDDMPPRRYFLPEMAHPYADTGTYTVTLYVLAENGCIDSTQNDIEIVQPPADFTINPVSACGPSVPASLTFTADKTDIALVTWYFGDGSIDTLQSFNAQHTYTAVGTQTFTPFVLVKDIYGCTNFSSQQIQVKVPTTNFFADNTELCVGEAVVMHISNPNVSLVSWNYGDGSAPTPSGSHTYTQEGTYPVSLTFTEDGCSNTLVRSDYINVQQADASFTLSDSIFTCYPAVVNFNYTGNSNNIAQAAWEFRAGIQSPTFTNNPSYTYSEPGTYTSTLTVTTSNGCTASEQHTIEVTGPNAQFNFSPSFICSGDTVFFESSNFQGVEDYLWIFGDGSTSEEQNPVHIYTARGTVVPVLQLVQGNCEVQLEGRPLNVSAISADFELETQSDNNCEGMLFSARNLSNNFSQASWLYNGQLFNTTHLSTEFSSSGEQTIQLIISDLVGCTDTLEKTFTVIPGPVFSIMGDSTVCLGDDIAQLYVNAETGWNIAWTPEEQVSTSGEFSITTSPDSVLVVTATVTDLNGCAYSRNKTIQVSKPSLITRSPANDTAIFIGQQIPLNISSNSAETQFFWSPDYNISCTNCEHPLVHPHESTTYFCRVVDECYDLVLDFPVEVIIDFYLELPTAFSPNGDEQNDLFRMQHDNLAEVDFKIFNRWGNLMFSTQNADEGWDGTSNGQLQSPGSYAYVIRAKTTHGYEFERKGMVLLLR